MAWLLLLISLLVAPGARAQEGAFPTEVALRIDDGRAPEALALLEPLIAADPDAPLLRLLRAEALAGLDPHRYVRAHSGGGGPLEGILPAPGGQGEGMDLPPLGGSPADLFEARCRLYVRARVERSWYRGDGEETAAAFIERMGALALRTREEIQALPGGDPYTASLRAAAAQLARSPLADPLPWTPGTPEGDFMLLWAADQGLPLDPTSHWQGLVDSPSPWRTRAQLLAADRGVWDPGGERVGALREMRAQVSSDAFLDDVSLRLAQAMMMLPGETAEAEELLKPSLEGPWRNTSREAVLALGAELRWRGVEEQAILLYQAQGARSTHPDANFDRALARSLARLERWEEAVTSYRARLAGPRGTAMDYLYLAQAAPYVGTTQEALTLAEFAVAVRRQELEVEGWRRGAAPQVTALRARGFELQALGTHAMIFPATFVGLGGMALLELLALAAALMIFSTWPRLARRTVVPAAGAGVLGAALMGLGLLGPVPTGLGGVGHAAWWLYWSVRTAMFVAAGLIASSAAGGRGLGLTRLTLARARGRVVAPTAWWPPVALGAAAVWALLTLGPARGEASPYLDRLPTVLGASMLGITPPAAVGEGEVWLRLGHALAATSLVGGLLPGVVLLSLGWRRGRSAAPWSRVLAPALGVALGAALWASLLAGGGDPPSQRLLLSLGLWSVVGWVGWFRGLDVAAALALCIAVAGV